MEQHFNEKQKKEIMELIQESIARFMEENKEEFSLMKTVLNSQRLLEIVEKSKASANRAADIGIRAYASQQNLPIINETMESPPRGHRRPHEITHHPVPVPSQKHGVTPGKPPRVSQEAPVISPHKIPQISPKRLPLTTTAHDAKKFAFPEAKAHDLPPKKQSGTNVGAEIKEEKETTPAEPQPSAQKEEPERNAEVPATEPDAETDAKRITQKGTKKEAKKKEEKKRWGAKPEPKKVPPVHRIPSKKETVHGAKPAGEEAAKPEDAKHESGKDRVKPKKEDKKAKELNKFIRPTQKKEHKKVSPKEAKKKEEKGEKEEEKKEEEAKEEAKQECEEKKEEEKKEPELKQETEQPAAVTAKEEEKPAAKETGKTKTEGTSKEPQKAPEEDKSAVVQPPESNHAGENKPVAEVKPEKKVEEAKMPLVEVTPQSVPATETQAKKEEEKSPEPESKKLEPAAAETEQPKTEETVPAAESKPGVEPEGKGPQTSPVSDQPKVVAEEEAKKPDSEIATPASTKAADATNTKESHKDEPVAKAAEESKPQEPPKVAPAEEKQAPPTQRLAPEELETVRKAFVYMQPAKEMQAVDGDLTLDQLARLSVLVGGKRDEVAKRQKDFETVNKEASKPIIFEIGLTETFLEVDQGEEVKQFYSIASPSPMILLMAKIVVGLLNRWELINPNDANATWTSIKAYFSEQMKDNISNYLLEKVRNHELDFSPENIMRIRELTKWNKFDEQPDLKESGLFEVLYLGLIDPALRTMGISQKGEPYFVWSVMECQRQVLQKALDALEAVKAKAAAK